MRIPCCDITLSFRKPRFGRRNSERPALPISVEARPVADHISMAAEAAPLTYRRLGVMNEAETSLARIPLPGHFERGAQFEAERINVAPYYTAIIDEEARMADGRYITSLRRYRTEPSSYMKSSMVPRLYNLRAKLLEVLCTKHQNRYDLAVMHNALTPAFYEREIHKVKAIIEPITDPLNQSAAISAAYDELTTHLARLEYEQGRLLLANV